MISQALEIIKAVAAQLKPIMKVNKRTWVHVNSKPEDVCVSGQVTDLLAWLHSVPVLSHRHSHQNRHYGVMSLTEYQHNREFAGRNWNAGEIIELVLRRPDHSL